MALDINRIRYFRCIVKTGSLRSAAKVLGLSPGALSKAMKNLEAETGLSLFTSEAQKSSVSDQGLQLFERSHRLIAEWESFNDFIHDQSLTDKNQVLRFASYGGFISHALPQVFSSEFDRLSFLFRLPGEIESAIVEGEADLGLTHMPAVHEKVRHRKIGTIKMVLLQKPGAWTELPLQQIPMAVPHPPVLGETFAHINFDGWPVEKYSRNVVMTTESVDLGLQFCSLGRVAMYAPSYLLGVHNKISSSENRLQTRPLPEDFPLIQHDVFLVMAKGMNKKDHTVLEDALADFFSRQET